MKKLFALLCSAAIMLAGGTACTKGTESSENVISIPEFSYPDQILGAESTMIPKLEMDQYAVPENDALKFVEDMKLGWNLGNTFDASDCNHLSNEMDYEKAWCGQMTRIEHFAAIKAAGFNTIRIPVSWHNHVDENFKISDAWMARVKEVVDWALACDLYVILNTHHDVAEAYYYPDSAHLESSKRYLTSVWTQMAETFKEYDSRLILESLNEPRLVGTKYEWWLDPNSAECKDAANCINILNQLFVDTVRGAGGLNTQRYLMCPGYCASADGACTDLFVLPTDTAENVNKIIVSVHAYTPYNFALNKTGTKEFSVDDAVSCSEIGNFMDRLYGKFIANGIPVVIGEFGALNKDNLEQRVQFSAYYVAAARARGISCCWWDNNAFSGSGENFGLLYRTTAKFMYPDIVQALVKYAEDQ